MTTCPVCGQPMSLTRTNRRARKVCSQSCGARQLRTHQSEVDPVAVARLVAGDPPARTTRAERTAATAVLTRRGRSYTQIADHLHITARSVARYVHELHNQKEAA